MRTAARLPVVLLAGAGQALAGCASSAGQWSEVGGAAVAEAEIHEQTVRYAVRHYRPAREGSVPAVFCLAVSRRASAATRTTRPGTGEVWVPASRLLSRLADVTPAVVAGSECGLNSAREEIHTASGRRAVFVHVSVPSYETPERALVLLTTRESPRYAFRYRCELRREGLGWGVLRCL